MNLNINFYYDLDKDVGRYFYTASKIAGRFYGSKYGYVVKNIESVDSNLQKQCIHFPDFGITDNEWSLLKKSNIVIEDLKSTDFPSYEKVLRIIKDDYPINTDQITKLEAKLKKCRKSIEHAVTQTTLVKGEEGIFNKEIYVYITNFGTESSYKIFSNKLNVYIRRDAGLGEVVACILAALIRSIYVYSPKYLSKSYELHLEWVVIENIRSYLMRHTELSVIFPNYKQQSSIFLYKKFPNLAKINNRYLKELGFGPNYKLAVRGTRVYTPANDEILGLSPQEFKALKLFINKANDICSYEELAKLIWKDEYLEKFSMYALNKLIFKIRSKLKLNHLTNVSIKTKRNEGYGLFYN